MRPVLNQYGTRFVPYFRKCPIHVCHSHISTESNNNDPNKTQGTLRPAKLLWWTTPARLRSSVCLHIRVVLSRLLSDGHHTPALLTKPAPFKNVHYTRNSTTSSARVFRVARSLPDIRQHAAAGEQHCRHIRTQKTQPVSQFFIPHLLLRLIWYVE